MPGRQKGGAAFGDLHIHWDPQLSLDFGKVNRIFGKPEAILIVDLRFGLRCIRHVCPAA